MGISFGNLFVHQALVLTHEGASRTEQFPFLAVMLFPTPVVEFCRRNESRDLPCRLFEGMFHWWKDRAKESQTRFQQLFFFFV